MFSVPPQNVISPTSLHLRTNVKLSLCYLCYNTFLFYVQTRTVNPLLRMSYLRLVESPRNDPGGQRCLPSASTFTSQRHNRRILAGNTLVSSGVGSKQTNKTNLDKQPIELRKWWETEWLIGNICSWLGIQFVFLGQVENDDQLLYHIQKNPRLPSPRLVCKCWAQISRNTNIIDLRPVKYQLNDFMLHKALQVMNNAEHLNMSECRKVRFETMTFTSANTKNIQILHMVGCCHLTDDILYRITLELSGLKELFVASCTKLEKVPIHIPSCGSVLESLDISANQLITDETINRLILDHTNLREIYLSQMEQVFHPNIASDRLELINIDGCENLRFPSVNKIIQNCPNLRYVTFGENDNMLEDTVKLFSHHQWITELNISGIYQGDNTVNTALESLPNLLMLDVSNSEFVKTPKLKHPLLNILIINLCCELQSSSFLNINENLPKLKHLSANRCESLVRPKIFHSSLELLDFSSCICLLSDNTTETWCDCPQLKKLFLGCNVNVTDEAIKVIAPYLGEVTDLNIYQATSLVSPDISQLTSLQRITITNCWGITQQWLDELDIPTLRYVFF